MTRDGFARVSGVARSTLQEWEARGYLPPFAEADQRVYANRLRLVCAGLAVGMSLYQVREALTLKRAGKRKGTA